MPENSEKTPPAPKDNVEGKDVLPKKEELSISDIKALFNSEDFYTAVKNALHSVEDEKKKEVKKENVKKGYFY